MVLDEDVADDSYMAECVAAGWQVRAPDAWEGEELVALLDERQ